MKEGLNKKMKVLWFCNVIFSEAKSATTGSWLFSMSESLINTGEIELFIITEGKVKSVTQQNYKSINQWFVPTCKLGSDGLPKKRIIKEIQEIVDEIKPDVIHVWGTENYWGLLYSRGYLKGNFILEIQGLKYVTAKYFYSGLSFWDVLKTLRLKEFLRPSGSLIGLKLNYKRWGRFEKEMLLKFDFISTQSEWVRTYIRNINAKAQFINTKMTLREEFLNASKWNIDSCTPFTVFTSTSASSISYKGLHVLIDAIAILKNRFPQIKLCIAGNLSKGIRMDGYTKWLFDKIKNNGIHDNIIWLGSLNAENIVIQMKNANVVAVPSFVESYCLALDEALTVGTPTVVSFAGAMPELAEHKKTALFYSPGDIEMCANAIEKVFVDRNLSMTMSEIAHNEKRNRSNENIAVSQLKIYKEIAETIG